MKTRRTNYDLLRVAACYFVVFSHTAASFVETFVWDNIDGIAPNHPLFSCVFTVLGRFTVPVFIMLSGAFLLRDERTADVKTFYRRSFWRIGPPAAAAMIFAVIYSAVTKVGMDHMSLWDGVIHPLLSGAPFYHLWYLPVLFGLYLLAPFIYGAKEKLTDGGFVKASVFMLAAGNLALYVTGPVNFHWNIAEIFCYAGYFMIGAVLFSETESKNNRNGILLIAAGFLIEVISGYLLYRAILSGMDRDLAEHLLVLSYTPFTTAAALLIFAGFGRLNVRGNYAGEASHSYDIYLMHSFVLDMLIRICRFYKGQRWLTHLDSRIAIFLTGTAVYLICRLLSQLVQRKKNKI